MTFSKKNCQKIEIFSKKIAKNFKFFPKKLQKIFIFFKKIANGNFFEKNENFWQFFWKKFQVFGNFLTVKWKFSGGSDYDPLDIDDEDVDIDLIENNSLARPFCLGLAPR